MGTGLQDRTRRSIVWALLLFRVAQYAPFLLVGAFGHAGNYRDPALVWFLLFASCAWSVALFSRATKADVVSPRWAVADILVAITAIAIVELECETGAAGTWDNWAIGPAAGTAVVAAMWLSPRRAAVGVAAISLTVYLASWPSPVTGEGLPSVLGSAFTIVALAAAAGAVGTLLLRSAREAETAMRKEGEALIAEAQTRARFDERTRQYRRLHDTVLPTLGAIARGGLDHRTREVRERCAVESDFLRGLITGSAHDLPTDLGAELATVARECSALGIDVRTQFDVLPSSVPLDALTTISSAIREALNNAAKHSGQREVWLTVVGEADGAVRASVVDHGRGFDVEAATPGFGLRHSLAPAAQGLPVLVEVTSWVGDGTIVEVAWSPESE